MKKQLEYLLYKIRWQWWRVTSKPDLTAHTDIRDENERYRQIAKDWFESMPKWEGK